MQTSTSALLRFVHDSDIFSPPLVFKEPISAGDFAPERPSTRCTAPLDNSEFHLFSPARRASIELFRSCRKHDPAPRRKAARARKAQGTAEAPKQEPPRRQTKAGPRREVAWCSQEVERGIGTRRG